jgi:hypothetical protein
MSTPYSKRSLAIPAETTGRFFPLSLKSNWDIIFLVCSIYQIDMANSRIWRAELDGNCLNQLT